MPEGLHSAMEAARKIYRVLFCEHKQPELVALSYEDFLGVSL